MRLLTKLGSFSIIQTQPPDDGDAAVYHVRAGVREELERLLHVSGLHREIMEPRNRDDDYHVVATHRDILDFMSTLAETIDDERL